MITYLAQYFETTPAVIVLWLVAAGIVLLYVVGAVVFALMAAREERQQQAERERFERYLQANTPPKDWPTPRGPHGFRQNGRRAS